MPETEDKCSNKMKSVKAFGKAYDWVNLEDKLDY